MVHSYLHFKNFRMLGPWTNLTFLKKSSYCHPCGAKYKNGVIVHLGEFRGEKEREWCFVTHHDVTNYPPRSLFHNTLTLYKNRFHLAEFQDLDDPKKEGNLRRNRQNTSMISISGASLPASYFFWSHFVQLLRKQEEALLIRRNKA